MTKTLLVIGTRKGLFLAREHEPPRLGGARPLLRELARLPGDPRRPRPTRSTRQPRASGTARPSGAAATTARRWAHSSEGLAHDDERKISKVASSPPAHGRVLVGAEAAGIWESRDGGETWSKLTTLEGSRAARSWDDPANQPPGHLGISALMTDADDPERFWAIVQGVGFFETADDGEELDAAQPRAARRLAARARGDRLLRPPPRPLARSTPTGMYQQNHVGMHRSDDGGHSWTEITEGLPSEFGFAAATHPHDRDTFYVIPLDPLHSRTMPDGQAAVWRTRDAGSSWQTLDERAAAAERAISACCALR